MTMSTNPATQPTAINMANHYVAVARSAGIDFVASGAGHAQSRHDQRDLYADGLDSERVTHHVLDIRDEVQDAWNWDGMGDTELAPFYLADDADEPEVTRFYDTLHAAALIAITALRDDLGLHPIDAD